MPVEDATDAEIIEALEKLARDAIDAGTFVILEADTARNYYVQFAVQDGGMYCEAVSNQYLAPEHQLDDEQTTALEGLGWREGEYEGQNWVRTLHARAGRRSPRRVGLVRQALTEVYGLPEGVPLRMTRSWDGQVLAAESAIEFASEGHRTTYERISSYVAEIYPDTTEFAATEPMLFVQHGSTVVTVAISPVEVHSSVVDLYALVVREPPITPELMRWMLEANNRYRIGALSLDEDGDVVLKHCLLGDLLAAQELRPVLTSFVTLADELDDEISADLRRLHGTRLGRAHGMIRAMEHWDRVPIEAQSVDAPLSRAAVFLVLEVAGDDAATSATCSARSATWSRTSASATSTGGCRASSGSGRALWDRLSPGARPKELHPFARDPRAGAHGAVHARRPAVPHPRRARGHDASSSSASCSTCSATRRAWSTRRSASATSTRATCSASSTARPTRPARSCPTRR